jgi:hypothetical protein
MADLKISELAALAGGDLASGDLLPVVDVSASETKKITVTDLVGNAVTLIADATIPGAKILFGSGTIAGSALANGAVGATQVADDAITAAKLGNESTVDLVTTLPGSGAFTGQLALDTDDLKVYCWDGSAWQSIKAAGSINAVSGDTSGIVNISITTTGDSVAIAATLDNTSAAAQFLAGPTASSGAPSYRVIAAGDLPTATTSAKGAVQVNGAGLTLSGDTLQIDNTVTANTSEYHVVQYTARGLVTAGRVIQAGDLPLATSGTTGVMYPGSGLAVNVSGQINHTNSATPGTFTKVTVDAQGHISAGASIEAADLPNHSAALLTTGTLEVERIANDAITGVKLADRATAQFGDTQPTAEYIGQLYFNSLSRDIYIWDGNVWQPIGISVGEIVFAGTYDAGTNLVASVTSDGSAVGLTVGQALPAASTANNRYYLVVAEAGTGTSPAPTVALSPPDIILSNGSNWTEIDVSQTITAQVASNVSVTPAGNIAATNVQGALEELDNEKLAKAGGTVTGELLIGTAGSFAFEGSTANDYELYLAAADVTADRTITFPDVTGTVITTGDTGTVTSTMIANGAIVDADINASAAISGSKIVAGTTSVVGVVQLTDSTSSTSTSTAATPNAVKSAYDLANAALPKTGGTMTGAITFAAGQTISGYAALATAQSFTAAQRGSVVALTDGASITPDFALSNNWSVTLGGNRTLANPSNLTAGQSGTIVITQDGTGSRTLAYGSNWKFPGGTAPTLTTTASAVDVIAYYVESASRITARLISDVK